MATRPRSRRWFPARSRVSAAMFYIDRLDAAKPGYWENKIESQRIFNGVCTRLGEKEMNTSVNAFLDQMKANGELSKAHEKWMKRPLPDLPDHFDGVPFT